MCKVKAIKWVQLSGRNEFRSTEACRKSRNRVLVRFDLFDFDLDDTLQSRPMRGTSTRRRDVVVTLKVKVN